jgi:hypothetical protein
MMVLFFCIAPGCVAADDEVDFVNVEKLGVNAGDGRRIGLVVVIDELDLTAEQPALGIGFLLPDLGAQQCLLAVRRKRTGQRHAESDLDGVAALGEGRCRDQCGREQRSADAGVNAAPGDAMIHGFPPKGGF